MSKRKSGPTPGIGDAVEVYWPQDKRYYAGRVQHFNKSTNKFCVLYDDGDVEYLNFEDEQWRFSRRMKKRKSKVASATATRRGRTTAPKPNEAEILLEEAHQVVLKVVRKTVRRFERTKQKFNLRLVIRTAENVLCTGLTDPNRVLGAEPVHEFNNDSKLVLEQVAETISNALKDTDPGSVKKGESKDVTRVIRTSLSLIHAARACLEYGDSANK